MHRLLRVEDPLPSDGVIGATLSAPDFELVHVRSIAEARELVSQDDHFALVLLDLSLPDGDGLTLMRQWHAAGKFRGVPVMLMSAQEDVETKILAFALGAEDYLVKPVDPRELRARVDRRLRRATELAPQETLQRGCLILNFPMMRAALLEDGREIPVDFTSKEFRLVATLASREGQLFTRAQLVKEIWGGNMHVVNRTVDSHICGARRKLGPAGDYIQSVAGSGYRFQVRD